jgi:hypothetical protein
VYSEGVIAKYYFSLLVLFFHLVSHDKNVLHISTRANVSIAWMIAAVLPLPPKPQFEMKERDDSTAQFQIPEDSVPEPFYRRVAPIDDSRYQSARWWRNLNRYMSVIGLLIIGVVIALIVVGVNQRWGK